MHLHHTRWRARLRDQDAHRLRVVLARCAAARASWRARATPFHRVERGRRSRSVPGALPPPCMTYRVVGHVGRECLHNALDVRTVVVICDMRVKALAALRPMVCAVPRESVSA